MDAQLTHYEVNCELHGSNLVFCSWRQTTHSEIEALPTNTWHHTDGHCRLTLYMEVTSLLVYVPSRQCAWPRMWSVCLLCWTRSTLRPTSSLSSASLLRLANQGPRTTSYFKDRTNVVMGEIY